MKLSKSTARMTIVFFNLGVIILVMGVGMNNKLVVSTASVLFGAAFIVRFYMLRCPHCGHPGPIPKWKGNDSVICRKCGEKIEYQ